MRSAIAAWAVAPELSKKRGTRPALSCLALVLCLATNPALSQGPAGVPGKAGAAKTEVGFDVLAGRWVRPDGGYLINIRSVDAAGTLEASYANPNPLPFSRAQATRDGKTLKVFLELRAGGYNGSTYTLSYDPVNDVLKGVYFQAVAQQKYDIYFTRVK